MSESEKWKDINKCKEDRPKLQEYKNWKELPPIPISLPLDGAIGITGNWRTFRPVIDQENCNQCGFCWMYCPEGVIKKTDDGKLLIELQYCKGCGICARECPTKNIEMIRESELEDD